MYKVNVSSVNDFAQCRFRWFCKWVMNRVPVAESPALDAGKILHRAFERHFRGESLAAAAREECHDYRLLAAGAHPAARAGALKAVQQVEDLIEALPLWLDKFPVDEVLEVEQPFEWPDPEVEGVVWLGRPDRVVRSGSRRWHVQNRGLAASVNFGTYARLQRRSYHEHLYAEARGLDGTVFNLVRKLKYRTNVGKRNEATKSPEEMFFQVPVAIDRKSRLHRAVMMAMRQHVAEMRRVEREWRENMVVPAPNEKMSGGYGGNSEDPYFRVLIGEIKLSDDAHFKPRQDQYAETSAD